MMHSMFQTLAWLIHQDNGHTLPLQHLSCMSQSGRKSKTRLLVSARIAQGGKGCRRAWKWRQVHLKKSLQGTACIVSELLDSCTFPQDKANKKSQNSSSLHQAGMFQQRRLWSRGRPVPQLESNTHRRTPYTDIWKLLQ